MKNALLALVMLFLACCPSKPKTAPIIPIGIIHAPVVWIDDSVRAQLKRDWNDRNPAQVERAFCGIVEEQEYTPGTPQYTLITIVPSFVQRADPSQIRHLCPKDISIPLLTMKYHFTDLHIHTPTTCKSDDDPKSCRLGGREAWECYPSSKDYDYLLAHQYKVAFLQCSAEAIVPYFDKAYWIE